MYWISIQKLWRAARGRQTLSGVVGEAKPELILNKGEIIWVPGRAAAFC